jgi:hypothetical protein
MSSSTAVGSGSESDKESARDGGKSAVIDDLSTAQGVY